MSVKYYLLFGIALLALSLFFDYQNIISLKPCSTHTWRQADGAAIAANYSYWLAALCYKISDGVHVSFLRGIHLLIFFGGLFGLFKITYHFLESVWLAFLVPLLFFTAPVLTFYANNFLPDAPAFGFLLMGWAMFFDYTKTNKHSRFWLAFVLFVLAGLMKITMLMSVVALGLVFVLEVVGWVKFGEKKLFPKPLHTIIGFALVFGLVGAWYMYLQWYKAHHGNDYFFAQLKAIWSGEDMNLLVYTLYRTLFFWSKYYFFPLVHRCFSDLSDVVLSIH